jgi:hypothetical protein
MKFFEVCEKFEASRSLEVRCFPLRFEVILGANDGGVIARLEQ